MAKNDQPNLFEKHVEKISLGLAAVVLLVVLLGWVMQSPHGTAIHTEEPVSPKEWDATLRKLADDAQQAIEGRARGAREAPPDWVNQLARDVANPFPATFSRSPVLTMAPRQVKVELAPILGPTFDGVVASPPLGDTRVWAGLEVVQLSAPGAAGASARDMLVAHVTTTVDVRTMIEDWRARLRAPGIPVQLLFLRVVAERSEQLPDGTWSRPVELTSEVLPGGAQPPLLRRDAMAAMMPLVPNPAIPGMTVERVRALLSQFAAAGVQKAILQPEFFPILLDEPPPPPPPGQLPPPRPVPRWITWRRHLPETPVNRTLAAELDPERYGTMYYEGPHIPPEPEIYDDLDVPNRTTRGRPPVRPPAVQPAQPQPPAFTKVPPLGNQFQDGLVQVWAHDVSIESGKTYRYRLRVDVLNPVYGEFSAVADRARAEKLVLSGHSGWSEPARVPTPTRFYVLSPRDGVEGVAVAVYQDVLGQTVGQTFTVLPGDPIGGPATVEYVDPATMRVVKSEVNLQTGAVLVDYVNGKQIQVGGMLGSIIEAVVLTGDGRLTTRSDYGDRGAWARDRDAANVTNRWVREASAAASRGY